MSDSRPGPPPEKKPRILVVDDEQSIRRVLERLLEMHGCETREAGSAEQAASLIEDWEPDVALIDIVLPGKNGIQFLGDVKQRYTHTEVLMMTGNASAETALQAIRRGAHDYLQKPFESLRNVWDSVQRALERRKLVLGNQQLLQERAEQNQELSSTVAPRGDDDGIEDERAMREIFDNFLSAVVQELDVDRASLMMLNRSRGELHVVVSHGLSAEAASSRIEVGQGIAGRVAQTGEPVLVTDVATDARLDGGRPDLSNSFISTPIVCSVAVKSHSEIFGVINVTNRRSGKPFTSDDVAFLSGLAMQLGVTIEGAQRSDELRLAYESLRNTQAQLVFSERIKAVGQMAAGVAHDFNNDLSIILARAQFALKRLETESPEIETVRSDLRTIVKVSLQGAETVKRIQDYTRIRKDIRRVPVDLHAAIRNAVEIARPKWKEQSEAQGISIDVELDLQEVPTVSGNVYELTQVISNLIFNAVEAMPEGGRLSIATALDGSDVVVRVTDTGVGMDEDSRARLFEPFFTTKDTGQGLGTSIVFGIVSRHGGQIEVDSAPGQGATFTILLPVSIVEPSATPGVEVEREGLPNVTARVLLVDDDDEVRETHQEVLRSGGHSVFVAANGTSALELCEKDVFDLVITDLSMPGMSGLDLATAIKRRDPRMPVILFSGWATQEVEARVRGAGVDHILLKPCLIEDLLDAVQRAVPR